MSTDLDEFYKKEYINGFKCEYEQFNGFREYDASFEVEMFETDEKGCSTAYQLGHYPYVNIPKYLKEMEGQVNGYREYLVEFIDKFRREYIDAPSDSYFLRLVARGILLLIKHSSTVNNGNYLIRVNLDKLIQVLKEKKYDVSDLEKIVYPR